MKKIFIILKTNIKKVLLTLFLFLIATILFFPETLLQIDKVNKLVKGLGFQLDYIQAVAFLSVQVSMKMMDHLYSNIREVAY